MRESPTWLRPLRRRGGLALRAGLGRLGYEPVHPRAMPYPPDFSAGQLDLYREVEPYTLTSCERVAALVEAVTYVSKAGIEGAIIECGVWRGGSMLAIAKTLVKLGDVDRHLYLFDTFDTMPPPGEHDIDVWGTPAADFFDDALAHPAYAYLPQQQVEKLMGSTGYPSERLHFVRGMVQQTIPDQAPPKIALCRLDTDWYTSTAHEMEHLFPRISVGGVLLIDDYGHLLGSRKAVDEYLAERGLAVLMHRIDYTGRMVLVTEQVAQKARTDSGQP